MNEQLLDTLRNFRLFRGLNPQELAIFANILTVESVPKDTLIIRENEEGSFIFLLLEGQVEISQALTLTLDRNKGDDPRTDTREKAFTRLDDSHFPFIGEMSLFESGSKRSANVKALSHCRIGKLEDSQILDICDQFPSVGYHVMKNIAEKIAKDLRTANQNVLKLTTALNFILE